MHFDLCNELGLEPPSAMGVVFSFNMVEWLQVVLLGPSMGEFAEGTF